MSDNDLRDFYNAFHKEKRRGVEQLKQEQKIRILQNIAPNRDVKDVLFVGCGQGSELRIFNGARRVGLDISITGLLKVKNNDPKADLVQGDAHLLPFISGSFDCVICSEVLEHLSEPEKSVREMHRLLRDRGYLVVTVPNWMSLYGVARKLGEILIRKSLRAGNQPIDSWFTPNKIKKMIGRFFTIEEILGIWYFPPTGRGEIKIPDEIVLPVLKFLTPLDTLLSKLAPNFGHGLAMTCRKIHRD